MRISDWSSDVCSSDLKIWLHISALSEVVFDFSDKINLNLERFTTTGQLEWRGLKSGQGQFFIHRPDDLGLRHNFSIHNIRSEEHTSELQSLMRISYAVFCLKTKNKIKKIHIST